MALRIKLTGVFVADQRRALDFYTGVLGFAKKAEVALPNGDLWLTVAAADGPDGLELLLEPNSHPAARAYQAALYESGIPAAQFHTDDLSAEHRRLAALGVAFRTGPVDAPGAAIAVLDDTCGNFILIAQPRPGAREQK